MFRSQLVKGTTPLLVLSVLREGELYGYEIAQRIRELSGDELAPGEGSLYPALHKLEQDGALESFWADSQVGPRRKYYRITQRGRGLLAKQEQEWAGFSRSIGRVVGGQADA